MFYNLLVTPFDLFYKFNTSRNFVCSSWVPSMPSKQIWSEGRHMKSSRNIRQWNTVRSYIIKYIIKVIIIKFSFSYSSWDQSSMTLFTIQAAMWQVHVCEPGMKTVVSNSLVTREELVTTLEQKSRYVLTRTCFLVMGIKPRVLQMSSKCLP